MTNAKQHLFVTKKKRKSQRRSIFVREVKDPPISLSHYCNEALNTAQGANEPIDPATEQNQSGPSGQDIDEFTLIWKYSQGWEPPSGPMPSGGVGLYLE